MPAVITLLHKPVGPTSFSLVQSAITTERIIHPKRPPKICHAGTLDPFAHGLLILLAGPATKLFEHFHPIPKTYDATVQWGTETDNGDPLGKPTFAGDPSALTPNQLNEALAAFLGWQDQTPPPTSNKRIAGERAYLKAHRGEVVTLPPTRVYLHQAQWLHHDLPRQSQLRITVRGGYYIRALARDLGRQLNCGAHLSALHRTAIGPHQDPGPDQSVDLQDEALLPWLPSRHLTDPELNHLRQKHPIPTGQLSPPDWPLPPTFPTAEQPLVRAFHRSRLAFLLKPEPETLIPFTAL